MAEQTKYNVPQRIRDYIRGLGYEPTYAMDGHIQQWDEVRRSKGGFWDWEDRTDGKRVLKVHRRSVHPAKRVCDEWASLLMNERTEAVCEDQACTDRLADLFRSIGFYARSQQLVSKAFSMGTCGWGLWLDLDAGKVQVRRYDAKCTLPLSWDDDGITECAFVTCATVEGKQVDQLVMHVLEDGGYVIRTRCWDKDGNPVESDDVAPEVATGSDTPTFAVWVPVQNTIVDCSPFGESLYAHAVDQVEGVDMAYDALVNEIDAGKMRLFISDSLIDRGEDGKAAPLPFGRDNTVFRKVDSMEEMVKEFAPSLRTESQVRAYRAAWQTLGDACGFGSSYFDIDQHGGVKTATEVASDNSALMRNVRMYENSLENAVAAVAHFALLGLRMVGEQLPPEGEVRVSFDDSIITDTAAEKSQDMAEVSAGLMAAWEYRMKWYGEDEATAKANDPGTAQAADIAELG